MEEIDNLTSLAIRMQAGKGAYALLIGSGVSSSAGILTGWGIVKDLIREIANSDEITTGKDEIKWYKENHGGKEPEYSDLLESLASKQAERNLILRSYFEPTQEERVDGWKLPRDAHRAIARLVAGGYIRVIITTNFDQLLEMALEEIGIVPTRISSPDQISGALPIIHNKCTLIKVHGDYLDKRILNTENELSKYKPQMDKFLKRIFEEFGLVVCGWSAKWDKALCKLILGNRDSSFSIFWAYRGHLYEEAKEIIKKKEADKYEIIDADSFFNELSEKVFALEEGMRVPKLTTDMAAAMIKRYLVDDRHRIKLHDLVMHEAKKVSAYLTIDNFPISGSENKEAIQKRLEQYDKLLEVLQIYLFYGCYWGDKEHTKTWIKCIELISNFEFNPNGSSTWIDLRFFPSLLLIYSAGLGSVAGERNETLVSILTKSRIKYNNRDRTVLETVMDGYNVLHNHSFWINNMQMNYKIPLSIYLDNVFKDKHKSSFANELDYLKCFDRFEYLKALIFASLLNDKGHEPWDDGGLFLFRYNKYSDHSFKQQIDLELEKLGAQWPLLKAGLCGGSIDLFKRVKADLDYFLEKKIRT
jgi:hypothetical protein